MKIKVMITAAFLALASQALAFETVSLAYEVALSDMTGPATENSRVMFRECDDCDSKSVRVDGNTRYMVNGRNVRFADFRSAIQGAHDSDTVPVTILHNLEADIVVSISVTLK